MNMAAASYRGGVRHLVRRHGCGAAGHYGTTLMTVTDVSQKEWRRAAAGAVCSSPQPGSRPVAGRRRRRRSRFGFTLIELLVVIAIIALLVSILVPSLSRAKDLAKGVVCASALRQLSFALTMYTEENDGILPSYDLFTSSPRLWYQFLQLQVDDDVWQCPSEQPREINWNELCYGYNAYLGYYTADGSILTQKLNMSDITGLADRLALADSNGDTVYDSYLDGNWAPVGDRHQEGGNVAWLDGHVSWRLADDLFVPSWPAADEEMKRLWCRPGYAAK